MSKRITDPSRRHLAPARVIVEKLGGVAATAQAAGVDESRVRRWMMPRERGGTGGLVPTRNQQKLLEWSRAHNKGLRPADFFDSKTELEWAS